MPHIFIDYSANLDEDFQSTDLSPEGLMKTIHEAILATGIFPAKGARSRVSRRETYLIANGAPENAFIHVICRIGLGRTEAQKQMAGDAVFEAMKTYLKPISVKQPIGFAFEFTEVKTWKFNSLRV